MHVDIKKLGRIPDGGWAKVLRPSRGAPEPRAAGKGYCYVHSAVDDHSRLAYSEIHDDEKDTAVGFWRRARVFFAAAASPSSGS